MCSRTLGKSRDGLGQREEAVTIEVWATSANGSLALVVSDDGPGLLSPRPGHSGIGLTNRRTRLARLYGASARLVVEQAAGPGVRVTITLPIRAVPSESV
jgi:two-component system LytT family sensor kinase